MKDLSRPTPPGENPPQTKRRPSTLFRDFWIAVAFLFAQSLVLIPLGSLLHRPPNIPNDPTNPHGGVETICSLLLCLSAGICEETIFRGYLQRQFAAFTSNSWRGLFLQSIAFGASHGYQGIKLMTLIAAGGCLYGLLARWRKSLCPGIIAHFLEDAAAGVLAPRLLT
jgi:membrane protease YdiL (CAAX protease family)